MNTTRHVSDTCTEKLTGNILTVVTRNTKEKERVLSQQASKSNKIKCDESWKGDFEDPKTRRGWRKSRGTYFLQQHFIGEGFFRVFPSRSASERSLIPLSGLYLNVCNDSGDLGDELDEFVHFMLWNGSTEEDDRTLLKKLESSMSVSDRPPWRGPISTVRIWPRTRILLKIRVRFFCIAAAILSDKDYNESFHKVSVEPLPVCRWHFLVLPKCDPNSMHVIYQAHSQKMQHVVLRVSWNTKTLETWMNGTLLTLSLWILKRLRLEYVPGVLPRLWAHVNSHKIHDMLLRLSWNIKSLESWLNGTLDIFPLASQETYIKLGPGSPPQTLRRCLLQLWS
jgi:hypothetical protein